MNELRERIYEELSGYMSKEAGDVKKAEALNKAVISWEKILKENEYDSKEAVEALGKIAVEFEKLGEYSTAIDCFSKVYDLSVGIEGITFNDFQNIIENKADCYAKAGRYEKAIELYEEVYKNLTDKYKASDYNKLDILNKLAESCYKFGIYGKAAGYYKKLYDFKCGEEKIGAGHLSALLTEEKYAIALREDGEYEDAEEIFEDVCEKLADLTGEKSVYTADALSNLALNYVFMDEQEKTTQICKKLQRGEFEVNEAIKERIAKIMK